MIYILSKIIFQNELGTILNLCYKNLFIYLMLVSCNTQKLNQSMYILYIDVTYLIRMCCKFPLRDS